MNKVYGIETPVQYQVNYDPQAPWASGTVLDFAEKSGIRYTEGPGADDSVVVTLPDEVLDLTVTLGSAVPEEVLACVGQPMMLLSTNEDGRPCTVFVAFLDPDAEDPDVTNGLWLESEDRDLYILPVDDGGDHEEIVGPDDETSGALYELWIEFTDPRDIPAERYEALGLTKVDDCLKRHNPVDGYYHA